MNADFDDACFAGRPMDYQGFTDDSLITMYAGVREALAADDMFRELGLEGRFRVRKTPAWKLHAADLEAEMLRRGISFEVIEWYEADRSVDEMQAPPAVPGPSPLPSAVEPSRSQMVLASLSAIDVVKDAPADPVKEKRPKRRTRASDK
jgi:hypothetical protein